ncbi:MAG: hypothetical protein IPK68_08880 [Bdellovibrionales bacterium]|nr:hypothetical protein [Bdellovibrionales bacterium]
MEKEEGKKLLSKENHDLYQTFEMSRKLKKISFADLAQALECTELEAARVQRNPAFSPCYRLIKMAETLGENAIFETRLILNSVQTKSNIHRIHEKYKKQLEEWSKINVVPIRDLSAAEIIQMQGMGAGFLNFELEIEERHKRPACVILDFVLKERLRSEDEPLEKEGELIEVDFKRDENEFYEL